MDIETRMKRRKCKCWIRHTRQQENVSRW